MNKDRKWSLFAIRPGAYVLVLAVLVSGAYLFKLRTTGIFACPAGGYGPDAYLAYCHATGYGDYDHGAFWFDLEPKARHDAVDAEVLFVGSSRMQFALSTRATTNWFDSAGISFYLLGFSHTENIVFAAPLLEKIRPRARVYVINVDGFFVNRQSPPVAEIRRGGDIRDRYEAKQRWQYLHRPICAKASALCGNQLAFFRSRERGTWLLAGTHTLRATGVANGPARASEEWEGYATLAHEFVSKLAVERECIILTIAPSQATKRAEAEAISNALRLELLAPELEGLRTFDGSHLEPRSAERWATAFFDLAGPRIRQCLEA